MSVGRVHRRIEDHLDERFDAAAVDILLFERRDRPAIVATRRSTIYVAPRFASARPEVAVVAIAMEVVAVAPRRKVKVNDAALVRVERAACDHLGFAATRATADQPDRRAVLFQPLDPFDVSRIALGIANEGAECPVGTALDHQVQGEPIVPGNDLAVPAVAAIGMERDVACIGWRDRRRGLKPLAARQSAVAVHFCAEGSAIRGKGERKNSGLLVDREATPEKIRDPAVRRLLDHKSATLVWTEALDGSPQAGQFGSRRDGRRNRGCRLRAGRGDRGRRAEQGNGETAGDRSNLRKHDRSVANSLRPCLGRS